MEDGDVFRRAFEDGVLGFVRPPKDEFVSLNARDGRDPPTFRLPFVIPISGEDSVSDL